MATPKNCGNCGKPLDPDEGVGKLPGTDIVVCGTCYRSIKNPN